MLWEITGWALWAFAGIFAYSGLYGIYRAARTRGSVTYMGLCQFGAMFTLSVLFVAVDWDKNHLAWLIPLCWGFSFTRLGMAFGSAIGTITQFLFPAR